MCSKTNKSLFLAAIQKNILLLNGWLYVMIQTEHKKLIESSVFEFNNHKNRFIPTYRIISV